jgi:ABC-type transport system involved in cytochrome c biogenesis permease subunit
MYDTGVFWLRVATGLYAVGLLHALLMLVRKQASLFRVALGAFSIGVVVHFVALVDFTLSLHQLPVNNFNETSSLFAFLIALFFLFVYWRYKFTSLSVGIFPLVFLMTQIGAMETPVATWQNTQLRDAWLFIHVVMVLLGSAALLFMAVASIFYLIQERQLKAKRPGSFFDRLPPLGTLDDLITRAMGFGFIFMTLGVITASTWAFIESGTRWISDPKIGVALVTWAFYLLMVFLRTSAGWRGRKAALMAIAVLGCSAITWAAHIGLRPLISR